MQNGKNLLPDTPEVANWVVEELTKGGIKIPYIEGYSVKGDRITGLFERRISNVDVANWKDDEVTSSLKDETWAYWELKIRLSSILAVPLYLVIWKNDTERFRILKLEEYDSNIKASTIELFERCSDIASWLATLKGIIVSKGFVEEGRLSLIDECLRKNGVPWPGNLDGFIIKNDLTRVSGIFEFSRTRKSPVETHDLNRFFSQDKNRWAVFDTLKKSLNCSAFIIIWSSDEKIIKLQKLKEVKTDGLVYDWEIIIKQGDVVSKISEIISI